MKPSFLIALMVLISLAIMAPIYWFKWRPLEQKMERIDMRTGFLEECYRANLLEQHIRERPYLVREYKQWKETP
jgi:hypothetical protein